MKNQTLNCLEGKNLSSLKHFFIIAVMLMAATQWSTAQEVSDGTNTYTPDQLSLGTLQNATTLTLTGEWNDAQIQKLQPAIKSDGLFYNENAILQTVDMSAVTFSGTKISFNLLFYYCTALASVVLPEKEVTQPVDFKSAFNSCIKLETVTNLDKFSNVSDFSFTFISCKALTAIALPTCTSATSVSFNSAFNGCTKLASVTNLDKFSDVSDFTEAFSNCSALTAITLSARTSATSVSFNTTFKNCRKLATVTNLDKFSNVSDFTEALKNCSALTAITLPTGTSATSVSFNYTFSGCRNLATVTNLDKFSNVSDFTYAFFNCSALTDITLPAGTSAASVSFNSVFYGCTNLATVTNFDKFINVSDFTSTFKSCPAFTAITLPEGTSATSVSFSYAFDGCTNLATVTNLDKFINVSSFDYAFYDCKALTSVKLGSVPTPNIFSSFNGANPNMLKYLPSGSEVPTEWAGYSNFIIDGVCSNDITLESNSPYYCPEAFTLADGKVVKLTYTPALPLESDYKSGWNSIAMPFDVASCSATLGSGSALNEGEVFVKAYTRSGFDKLGFVTISDASVMKADNPYLFGALYTDAVTFTSAAGVNIPITAPTGVTVDGMTFTADYNNTPLNDTKSTLVMNNEGSAYMIAANLGKADDEVVSVAVNPFTGYFYREAGKWIAETMAIADEADVPTGVENTEIADGLKIYGAAGKAVIEVPEAMTVTVSSVSGAVIGSYQVAAGRNEIELPQGVYIIMNEKVVVPAP